MPSGIFLKLCTALAGFTLVTAPVVFGQSPDEVDQADPSLEIERSSWLGDVKEDQALVVSNNFGNVICRFGGAEGQAEITATIQHFPLDGPRLEVVTRSTKKEVRAAVGFRENSEGELNTEPNADQLKRADLVVFVPEGRSLIVESRDGVIECRGIRGDVTATTTSGAVRLKGIIGRVAASTGSGPITVVFSPHGSKKTQRVETVTGKIEAHIPENADIEVRAATHGKISSGFKMDLTDDTNGTSLHRGVAVIGSPGSKLELTSDTGSIDLVRRLVSQ